jgi:hypothetical protein
MLACGSGDSDKSIGPNGGTVTSEDGLLTLEVPPGALSKDVTIKLSHTSDASDPLAIANTTYRIEAPDTAFAIPATLSLSLRSAVTTGHSTGPSTIYQAAAGDCLATTPQCTLPWSAAMCPADHPVLLPPVESAAPDSVTCALAPQSQPTLVSFGPNVVMDAPTFEIGTNIVSNAIVQIGNANVGATLDTERPHIESDSYYEFDGAKGGVARVLLVPPSTNVLLHFHASDNVGVTELKLWQGDGVTAQPFQNIPRPQILLAQSNGPVVEATVVFNTEVPGTYFYHAQARDAAGNSSDLGALTVYVDRGTATPQGYVTLAASASSVTANGDVTLTATPTGAVTVTKVEFYEGATKLGEATSAPFTQVLHFTNADNGVHTYYAKATASDATTGNSNNASVDVSIGVTEAYDFYVDPATGDDTHDGLTPATAVQTMCHAAELATAGQTIGLLDGTYDSTNQRPTGWSYAAGCGPNFSVSMNLVAVHQGLAVLKVPVTFNAGGSLKDVQLATDTYAPVLTLAGGTVAISGLTVADISSNPAGLHYRVAITGGNVTMTPGGVSNLFTTAVPANKTAVFAIMSGGHLTLNGVTLDDAVQFPAMDDGGCGALFSFTGPATLTLDGVTIRHGGKIIGTNAGSATIDIKGNSLLENRSTHAGTNYCSPLMEVYYTGNTVTISDSTIRGSAGGGGGSGVGLRTDGTFAGTVTLSNVTFESFVYNPGATGAALSLAGATSATASMTLSGVNTFSSSDAGIYVLGGVTVGVTGTTFQNMNNYGVRVTSSASSSVVDLGTSGSPGGNTFTNNTPSSVRNETTNTLNAAGNTWKANIQGADASGHYTAALVAGPASGANYELTGSGVQIQF